MTDRPSPATRLHDVVIIHEQSGVQWRASIGRIDGGRIVVEIGRATCPPAELLANPASTYTVAAFDAAQRVRRFTNVTFDRAASDPRQRLVFR